MKKLTMLLLCLVMAAVFILPVSGFAGAAETVRVGWYESPFNMKDQLGRRSGYAYEYQRKIAAYTGWKYEYVEGSWTELMRMLVDGEIDLMSDVSFMPERTELMLYSTLPMGTEAYYIYTAPGNAEITAENIASLNGKKIGVTQNSIQKSLLLTWLSNNGVEVELLELTGSEEESLEMLHRGEMDAFLTLDAYADPETAVPLWKIGASDFYFAVNKARPDLLGELNAAMSRIQDENRFYNVQMTQKYLWSAGSNKYLTAEETAWLSGRETIRVGYQDNYLAFCAQDAKTGELTGALKDYLAYAAECLENTYLNFEPVVYPTAAAAMEALQSGEIDCMFPANLTDYDSEMMGVVMSPPLMRTEMDAVVRAAEQKEFVYKEKVTVAVNEGNTNYEVFLLDHYPGWETVHYKDTPTCLNAVAAGMADCIIISNYRFNNISKQCEKLRLTTISTDVDLDYCFALREGDTVLYSILAKVTSVVPSSAINAALTYYSTEDAKFSFTDYVKGNLTTIVGAIAAVVLVITAFLLRGVRLTKKDKENHPLSEDRNKHVFVDSLTSVRNKEGFANYIQGLQERLDHGEKISYAVGMFDCNDLTSINDSYGYEKGDEYLKITARLICHTYQHSPVFRIGWDEFAVILLNEDYHNRFNLIAQFENAEKEMRATNNNPWEHVSVAMGVAVYEPHLDLSVNDTVNRAEKIMYDNKRAEKKGL